MPKHDDGTRLRHMLDAATKATALVKEKIGARNHLIHGYYEVDYDIVWQILKDDIPALIQALEEVAPKQ